MVRRDQMIIYDLEGVVYRRRVSMFYFCIQDRKLVAYETFGWKPIVDGENKGIGYFKVFGITEWSINEYYRDRVVQDGAMMLRGYLDALGLQYYDFEAIIKASCGWNPADREWLKFDGAAFRVMSRLFQSWA